ncbi:hypothetical protein Aduo_016253 [Ancylostoma duodenale]
MTSVSLFCAFEDTETCTSGLRQVKHFLHSDFPGIIFSGVELLMVFFFWFVNYYVDNNDFTKAYVTVLMVPLSGSTATKLWSVVNSVAGVSPMGTTYGDM